MIGWLRAQLERCLMDRAFRTLHEKIEDQDRQIRSLMAAREKVSTHIKQQVSTVEVAKKQKRSSQSELDRQIGINRVLKTKNHIEAERQCAIINQLRDYVSKETFLAICNEVRARPDSEFAPTPGKKVRTDGGDQ